MDTPKNKAGELTEKIMGECFSPFRAPNCKPIVKLETWQYNRIYSEIYAVLRKEFNN
ncbi:hypothetical protein KAU51_04155 [Candidatus Parcubacteria bacterium]|nr:hypothetical protein [Candidatus Parcubacteria bacterium]